MKQFAVLAVILHIICMAMLAKASLQDICDREKQNGNRCELSAWICKGAWEQQTVKITRPSGSWYSRSSSRSPCQGGGGGGGGGSGGCADRRSTSTCQSWKRSGYCTGTYGKFMKENCCKTCQGGSSTGTGAVNGGWSRWGRWGECTKLCGGGTKTARRQCNNPSPSNGGRNCAGQSQKTERCNEQSCAGGGGSGGSTTGASGACLRSANSYRAKHVNTPSMVWDAELARKAKAYADYLMNRALRSGGRGNILEHDQNRGSVGENLWYEDNYKTGDNAYYCGRADADWYAEIADYDYSTARSKNGKAVGHFTQMIWKATKRVGYGIAVADSPRFRGNKMAIAVARYSPQGNFNMRGRRFEDYSANVQRVK